MTSPTIETDLSKILERIEQNFVDFRKETSQKLDNLAEDVTDIKVGQARLEAELKGEIKALDERLTGEIKTLNANVTGLSKRLDNQEFVSRGVLVALIVAILGGFAKLFGFIGNA